MAETARQPLRSVALLTVSFAFATLWLHPELGHPGFVALLILLLWPTLALTHPVPWPRWRQAWNTVLLLAAVLGLAIWVIAPETGLWVAIAVTVLAEMRLAYNPAGPGHTRRMVGLATLLICLASLSTESVWFAVLAGPFMLCALATLLWSEVGLSHQAGARHQTLGDVVALIPTHGRRLWLPPARLMAVTAALGALIFLAFPRHQGVRAQGLGDRALEAQFALTGMAHRIELGAFEWLLEDPTPAIQVSWLDSTPPDPVYLRGAALARLTQVNGRWQWNNHFPTPPEQRDIAPDERTSLLPGEVPPGARGQRVELLDPDLRSLFALPWLVGVRSPQGGRLVGERGGRWRAPDLEHRWAIYEAWSDSMPGPGAGHGDRPLEDHLYVPGDLRVRARGFLFERDLISSHDPVEQRAQAIIHHLRSDHQHSLDLREIRGDDRLSDFIFNGRAGNCEYFSSAMTILCRAVGIPARMVTGFHGGEIAADGSRLFRRSDAHAWVEIWIDGRGWVLMDPTPADPLVANTNLGMWRPVSGMIGDVAGRWRYWVVRYEGAWHRRLIASSTEHADRFVTLLSGEPGVFVRFLEKFKRNLSEQPILWVLIAGLLVLDLAAAWIERRIRRHGWPWKAPRVADPREVLLRRMARAIDQRSRPRHTGETVAEYLWSVSRAAPNPVAPAKLGRLIAHYYAWRFEPAGGPATPRDLLNEARLLHRATP
jgi:hypothetical protein